MRAMKIKRNIKLRLYILTAAFIFAAGLCACGKNDSRQVAENRTEGSGDNSGGASDDTYDVFSVDSATGSDIDYGKYEVDDGSEAGTNDGNRGNNKTDDDGSNNIVDNKKNESSNSEKNDDKNNNINNDINNDNKNNGSKYNNTGSRDSNNKTKDNDIKSDNGTESKPKDIGATDKSTQHRKSNNNNSNSSNSSNSNNNSNNNNSSKNNNSNNNNNSSTDTSKIPTCSLLIDCTVLLSNMDKLDSEKRELVPEDGIILEKHNIEFSDGESAFDVLLRETRNEKIHMEYSFTPVYNSSYIEGIANLYEFDCGELSGWVYSVNDQSPNYGISKYGLKDGDVIHIKYTLER